MLFIQTINVYICITLQVKHQGGIRHFQNILSTNARSNFTIPPRGFENCRPAKRPTAGD